MACVRSNSTPNPNFNLIPKGEVGDDFTFPLIPPEASNHHPADHSKTSWKALKVNFKSNNKVFPVRVGGEEFLRVAVLYSGGKDSNLTVWRLLKDGYELALLITVRPANPESWMFHRPCVEFTPLQGEALGIPVRIVEVSGEKEREVEELLEAVRRLKREYGLEGLACGAIQSQYQRSRVERICSQLKLKMLSPLWGNPPESLLEELLSLRFDVVFTSVSALGLDERWLGRRLDREALKELKALGEKFRFNLALDGGEAETFVREACFFKRRVELEGLEKVWLGDWGYLKVSGAKLTSKRYSS
ncbi:MAG: diphthine--ammonia ligase [Candidatus Hecatellales archaeon]|nr:MAG: diphthine--ammonia ligase [Candidatus Hecatellales archaeon]